MSKKKKIGPVIDIVYSSFKDDGEVDVWLNTGVYENDGLCIGAGKTKKSAINRAIAELKKHIRSLELLNN